MFLGDIKKVKHYNHTTIDYDELERIIFENFDNGFKPQPVQLYILQGDNSTVRGDTRCIYRLGLYEGQEPDLDMLVINEDYYIIRDVANRLYRAVDQDGNIVASRVDNDSMSAPFKSINNVFKIIS
jgi:hypothetical protein